MSDTCRGMRGHPKNYVYVCMYVYVIGHSPSGLLRTNANKQWQLNIPINITRLRIRTGGRQTSWLSAQAQPRSWRHCSWVQQVGVYVPSFPQSGVGFSYPVVQYLLRRRVLQPSVFWCVGGSFAINWLWGPRWPIGPCIYTVVCVFSLSSVGKIRLHYLQNISDV